MKNRRRKRPPLDVAKELNLSEEASKILEEQRESFIQRHGREPGPDDKVFDLPPLEHLEAGIVRGMEKAGVNPAVIYAFTKTGFLVTESNRHLFSKADLAEWKAATDEYEKKQRPHKAE